MTSFLLTLALALFPMRSPEAQIRALVSADAAQEAAVRSQPSDSVSLSPHSHFGANLHQFLYVLGRARAGYQDRARPAVAAAAIDTAGTESMESVERAAWDAAVSAYADSLASRPMWEMGTVNAAMALWAGVDEPPPGLPANVRTALAAAAPIYRRVWWPRHDSLNRAWIRHQRPLIYRHGDALSRRLSGAFRQPWPRDTIPVEVTAYATWAGAFTTTDPVLVHISSTYPAHHDTGGLEQLYHEAGHTLVEPIFEALKDEAARRGLAPPRGSIRDLWHAVLFYTAGYAVREIAPAHVPYSEAWGVEARNPAIYALVKAHWEPWLRGEIGMDRALGDLVEGLRGSRDTR